jgi:hypothetical protein
MKKAIKEYTTDQLKQMWDDWDEELEDLTVTPDIREIHAELNLRGEGIYCAV